MRKLFVALPRTHETCPQVLIEEVPENRWGLEMSPEDAVKLAKELQHKAEEMLAEERPTICSHCGREYIGGEEASYHFCTGHLGYQCGVVPREKKDLAAMQRLDELTERCSKLKLWIFMEADGEAEYCIHYNGQVFQGKTLAAAILAIPVK